MKAIAQPKQHGAFDADEAELRAMKGGATSISVGIQDELMSEEADELATESPFKLPDWERKQSGAESLAGAALEVAITRQKLLGNIYSFDLDRGSLTYKANNPLYDFLVATSAAASRPSKRFQALVRHFERVVCDLLVAFAGGDARGLRIGWPSDRGLDKLVETMTSRRIARMKGICGFDEDEWVFYPAKKATAVRERAKDARIDIVVHRSMGDSRVGGLAILGQCGCGKNDVDESSRKHEELSSNWLSFFFGRTSVPAPLKVFATSQHIVRDDDLYAKQCVSQAIIIDRIRLCLLADAHPKALFPHKNRIETLTAEFLSAI